MRDVSGKLVNTNWGVVHHINGQPNWIDGPYRTRKEARDVKQQNDDETLTDPDVDPNCKCTIVRMTYLLPWQELFGEPYVRARNKGGSEKEKVAKEEISYDSK